MTPDPKLRLFVAFDVPLEFLEPIDEKAQALHAQIGDGRWTSIDRHHVTLKFLGWCDPEAVPTIVDVCAKVAAANHQGRVSLSGLGGFPNLRRPRVLWVGVRDPDGAAAALATDLDAELTPLGFEREERAFMPHLTLARFKQPRRLPVDLEAHPPAEGGTFVLEEMVLYRSTLARSGAVYQPVERFPLPSR